MTAPTEPHRTTTTLIWDGVEATTETVAQLQPPWPIAREIVVKADVGHHHQAPEVIEHSDRCLSAGASAVHLHVRDAEGRDTGDIGLWREVVSELRRRHPGVVIDSGLRGSTMDERLSHIREELFDVIPLLPTWDPDYLERPLSEMREHGVRPELCVWDGTDITVAASQLIGRGLVDAPAMWLIVPSTPYYGLPMPSAPLMLRGALHLVELIQAVDPDGLISFSAAGRPSSYLTTVGTLLGHHVRPGIGETPWRWPHDEQECHDPETLIRDAIDVAKALGRTPATAAQYRATAGLRPA